MSFRDDKRKKSMLVTVKSREQLLVETKDSVAMQIQLRRTKIIASISDQTNNYERVKEMIAAGANCFNLNVAYSKSQDAIQSITSIRDRIEQEQNIYMPLNLMLQGRQIRVGALKYPEIFLKKGTQLRLTSDKRVVGDANIISIDDETFFDTVHRGNKIVMDYGQVVVAVEAKEDSDQAFAHLMEKYPSLYPNTSVFRRSTIILSNIQKQNSSNSDTEQQSKQESRLSQVMDTPDLHNSEQFIHENVQQECKLSLRKQRFTSALKKQKEIKQKKKYKVLVCTVQGDCIMRPLRPVFLLNEADWMDSPTYNSKKLNLARSILNFKDQTNQQVIDETEEDSDDDDSQITSQDIVYIKKAKKCGFDSITISNVHKYQHLEELREIIGKDSGMKIIVRITTSKGVQNFAQLAKYADGCMLARAYLSVQSVIEGVVQQQFDMIKTAHSLLKPIIISSQILESMITSLIPTFSEMGDISNLVNEDVDSIMLTGETTYGSYPIQSISTLDRVCRQVETYQRRQRSAQYLDKDYYLALRSERNLVSNTVAQATVDAAYRIKAALIVVFTSTGSTAVKIAKLKPPSPVVAVTSGKKVARQLQIVGGIQATTFGTLYGTDVLFQKVIDQSIQQGLIQKGEFVVIISGQVENVSGQLNTLRIVQV